MQETQSNRRTFLTQIAAGALGGAAVPALHGAAVNELGSKALPTVQFGQNRITRLIMGGNPINGYSHSVQKISDLMREYFTVQRTIDILLHAEEEGITTFQSSYSEKVRAALTGARERGAQIQWICLAHAGEDGVFQNILDLKPIGIAHHGNRTDTYFQNGKPEIVRDFVKKVKDLGIFAGVSTHCPKHLAMIEDSGWENDFYMTCLYYLTRTQEELKLIYGDRLVEGEEPFVRGDPERMMEHIRQTRKPCLAFKLLGAGRNCTSAARVEQCFASTYAGIKPIDAAIVGMYPVLADEVRVNADFARKYSRAV
ncbi:MAG: hypothetical protein U0Q18_33440 [Bryobacteraceae bacterium]